MKTEGFSESPGSGIGESAPDHALRGACGRSRANRPPYLAAAVVSDHTGWYSEAIVSAIKPVDAGEARSPVNRTKP